MADSDIFVSNDVQLDVDFGTMYVIDQGIVIKVVAKKYDPTKTYVVGEYVIYQEKLYKCNIAIEEPEEFDAEKWNNVLLADEVQIANANIALKANINDVYDKSAIDSKVTNLNNAIALKANSNDVYAKNETYNQTEIDNALERKADADTVYTKEEIDNTIDDIADDITDLETALDTKADKSTTYTKTEIDTDIYKKTETYNKNEVDGIINNLPAPMIFKGTLGTTGTIADLPVASADNEGFTYKVITDGTYASISAKVGDMFTSNGTAWVHIPSGDEIFTDTWRSIKVNGTEKLSGSITSGSVDFKNGTNSTAVFDPSDNSIKFNIDGYTQSQIDTKLSAKANQADVTTALNNKADKSTTYTKTEVNSALALKADKSTTYTKTEVDNLVNLIGTVGPADICTFETNLPEPLQSVIVNIEASGGNGTPDNPNPIVGHTEANIVNTQNDSIVDLFSIDSDFRGAVTFNQLVQNGNFANSSNWIAIRSTLSVSNNVGTITKSDNNPYIEQRFNFVAGHKYLYNADLKANNGTVVLSAIYDNESVDRNLLVTDETWTNAAFIITPATTGTSNKERYRITLRTGNTAQVKNAYLIDLTAMFGSTIADYIYTLEQNNAGEGVAFFRNIYPEDYYAYDSGTTEIVGKETPEATIAFGQTVYGGVLDVTRGKLKPCVEYPSYNGETLSGRWLSSEATYVEGTTPPTGSQVVSLDDYGSDIDLTPVQIRAIVGTNNVFAGCGQTKVEFVSSNAEDTVDIAKSVIEQTNLSDLADIPNPPTTDGTYRLKVTIANGKATYSWEEIT